MAASRKMEQLQQDLQAVLLRERKAMAALDQAAELVVFSPSLSKLQSHHPILVQTGAKARSVLALHALGIFIFNESDQNLEFEYCDPAEERERLQREIDELIEQGAVAWALNRDRPRFLSSTLNPATQKSATQNSTSVNQELIMHCIATPARVRGIFLGVLAQQSSTLSDIQLPLLSIVLQQGAQMLESFELYNMHRQANLKLTENVRTLQTTRNELEKAHERLEETVQQRTADLAKAVESLENEARERMRVQEELSRRETTLRALFNATDNLVLMTDSQGRVLTCNKAATKAFGLTAQELRGKGPEDVMSPVAAQAARASLKKAVSLEQPVYHQHSQGGRDYSVKLFPVAAPDGEVMVAMFGHDVTDRLRAEQALRESEGRFRNLFEDSPVSLWDEDCSELRRRFDTLREQGVLDFGAFFVENPQELLHCASLVRVLDVNKATVEMYGARSKEELLQGLDQLLHERSMDCLREMLALLAHGGLSFHGESVNKTLDGRVIDVQVQLNVAPNHEKTLEKVVVSIIDLTQRKTMERAMLQAKETAEAASRAKSDFLANMSHEMRTPLNGVLGLTQIMLDMELAPDLLDFVETIHDNSQRLLHMVNDLLDLSTIDRKRFVLAREHFSLCDSVSAIASAFEERCNQKGLDFRMEVDSNIPDVLVGDVRRFKQVLTNLLHNAVKFTASGSVYVCIAESRPLGPSPQDENAFWLHCSVSDTGAGISEARQQQIFESFELGESYLTKSQSGAGLGLAIAREIVEKMGGWIRVQSEVGKGSTFFFTLRFELPDSAHASPLGDGCLLPKSQGLRLLFARVGTNGSLYKARLEQMLLQRGHCLEKTRSVPETLNALQGSGFDILVLDALSVTPDELEPQAMGLLQRIRTAAPGSAEEVHGVDPTLPVIILGQEAACSEYAGREPCLPPPWEEASFLDAMRHILRGTDKESLVASL